jgi:hypothetical protein
MRGAAKPVAAIQLADRGIGVRMQLAILVNFDSGHVYYHG